MFKNLSKVILDDCVIVEVQGEHIYPIFKNGSSSLRRYARDKKCRHYTNLEIGELEKITVYLRDPRERFLSGINTAISFNKITDTEKFLDNVQNFDFIDKHFVPQYVWISRLYKFFKGSIYIRNVNELYDLISYREKPNVPAITKTLMQDIEKIDYTRFVDIDKFLIENFNNKTINIKDIIGEGNDFLSKN